MTKDRGRFRVLNQKTQLRPLSFLSAANNVGNCLITNTEVDWTDVAVDGVIGAVSSGVGSWVTKKAGDAAKGIIKKGISRVVTGKNRYDSGSRYWKGAIKRGMSIISKGVKELNTVQGFASVIGSETAGILSISKTLVKTRRGTM